MLRPNIDERGASARRTMGVIALALGSGVALWIIRSDLPAWSAIILLPVFIGSGLGLFQAKYRTCVKFAAQGVCDLGSGVQKVTDPQDIEAMRRQARLVWRDAVIFGAAVTLAVWLVGAAVRP